MAGRNGLFAHYTRAEPAAGSLSACEAVRWDVAPDETVILLHLPSTFSRCINRDGEGASAK